MPLFARTEALLTHVREYVTTRIDAAKLDLADTAARVMSRLIAIIVSLLFVLLFVLFASVAGAHALGKWLGQLYWGYLIVAGFYLLLVVVIHIGRNRIIRLPIMNLILQELFTDEKNNEHPSAQG